MSPLLIHPGDLSLSQWVFLFMFWIVGPVVILYLVLKLYSKWKGGRPGQINKIIKKAKIDLVRWAKTESIPPHLVEFFEAGYDTLWVYVFYEQDADVASCRANGKSAQLEQKFRALLTAHAYPFDKFPKVRFEFDSHENVVRNYQGSYYHRFK